MANILGISIGTIVVALIVLPLSFVRGLIAKVPVIGGQVAGLLSAVAGIESKIPVVGKFY